MSLNCGCGNGEIEKKKKMLTLRQNVPLKYANTIGRSFRREIAFNPGRKSCQFFAAALLHILNGADTYEIDIVILDVIVDHFGCRCKTSHSEIKVRKNKR